MRSLLSVVVASCFIFSAACTRSKDGSSTSVSTGKPKGQVINIGNGTEPKDLDPATATGMPEAHILVNLFEGLFSYDAKTSDPVPGVAEKMDVSKDGLIYTVHLRKNAKWSNGDPLTAKDFVYSWTRVLNPATASEYAYNLWHIKGAKAYNEGKLTDASQLGFKAVDDYTLKITLAGPVPYFNRLICHHTYFPTHQATVEKFGARWTRPENMVTNGAFVLSRWETNKIISLKPNPHYWDASTVKLVEANYYPIEKQDTEEKMFRSGELDITNEIPLEKLPHWQKDDSNVFVTHPLLATYFYWVNTTKPPLNNKYLRQALAYSMDRTQLVKFVTRGGQLPAQALTPPGTGDNYQPPLVLPADLSRLDKAKELLAKAGYPEGKGLPPIEILYNTSDAHKKIAEAVQQMWKKNLGIEVTLVNQEWKVFLDSQKTKNYQLSRMGWVGDYNDPHTFVEQMVSSSGTNYSGWNNAKYDELVHKAQNTLDTKTRYELYRQAEELAMDELPLIPFYVYTHSFLKSKRVQGWYPSILDLHPLKAVSIVETP